MANIITSLKTTTQPAIKTPAPPYSFGTKEFNALKKGLLKNEMLNPGVDLKKFKDAVAQRGYDFFSSQSLQNWKDVFDHLDYADILQMSLLDTQLFLKSVQNPEDPEHDKNRTLFLNFGSIEEKVRQYFLNRESEEHGYNDRPFRDISHESRMLNINKPLSTKHAIFEYETFKKLMLAKWQAVGYASDEAYKEKFLSDYSIALTA